MNVMIVEDEYYIAATIEQTLALANKADIAACPVMPSASLKSTRALAANRLTGSACRSFM
ncbi:hypothetical protein [Rhizobium sp. YTU87027]|uniref:hypothetical protein n=1 Tax=Rhizobium sp. YTU87027 TaxID=3417741 RepID=UPI003D6834B2